MGGKSKGRSINVQDSHLLGKAKGNHWGTLNNEVTCSDELFNLSLTTVWRADYGNT